MFFSHHFRTFNENLSNVFETFPVHLTKLHSTSPEDQFEDITLLWQSFSLCFFHVLPNLNRESSVFFRRKTIGRFVTTAYHVSGGIFCRKVFLTKFFFFFIIGHWATFFGHFDGSLTVPLSVLFTVCQIEQFVVKKFLSKLFSHHFWTLIANLMVFVQNFFSQVDETASYKSEGSIWRQTSALKIFCMFFHPSRTLNEQLTVFSVGT